MNKLLIVLGSCVLALVFPVAAQAMDISINIDQNQSQQQQQQQEQNQVGTVNTQQQQQQEQALQNQDANVIVGDNGVINDVDNIDQDQNQDQDQNTGDGDNDTSQEQNGQDQQQQQQQQKQTQKVVAQVPTKGKVATKELTSAGVEMSIPFALASLGTTIAAYLRQKKQLATLSFLK